MAKNKEVDYTVLIAGVLSILSAVVKLGFIQAVYAGYDLQTSFIFSAGLGGLILLFSRTNIL